MKTGMRISKKKQKTVYKRSFSNGCLFVICRFICVCVFVCLGAGNVVHRSSADPEPGHGRCLYSFRQLAQQALSDGLLQGRPQPCQCTHTLALAHKHAHINKDSVRPPETPQLVVVPHQTVYI